MPSLRNTLTARAALAASVATAALFAGIPEALAQGADLFARGETIGNGLGRAGSAIMGPMFLIVGAIVFLPTLGICSVAPTGTTRGAASTGWRRRLRRWLDRRRHRRLRHARRATFTGGAPTASAQPFTFGR